MATSLHGLVDSILWGEIRPAPLLWWMWGLVMAAFNVSTELQTEDGCTSSNQRKKNIHLLTDSL
ncbi:MAG: hypothetical protein GWN92_06865 [candidate division Zixibacteria bacterium]|nr:hypothetical protein [candidate division Zixibacteria bacterium]